MLIKLTYFKLAGKYYSEGQYESEYTQMWQVFKEVKDMKTHPGLSGKWDGLILVDSDSDTGYPGIINL